MRKPSHKRLRFMKLLTLIIAITLIAPVCKAQTGNTILITPSLNHQIADYIEEYHLREDSLIVIVVYHTTINDSNLVFIAGGLCADFFQRRIPFSYYILETSFFKGKYLVCIYNDWYKYVKPTKEFAASFYSTLSSKIVDPQYKLLPAEGKMLSGCESSVPIWKLWIGKKSATTAYIEGRFYVKDKQVRNAYLMKYGGYNFFFQ